MTVILDRLLGKWDAVIVEGAGSSPARALFPAAGTFRPSENELEWLADLAEIRLSFDGRPTLFYLGRRRGSPVEMARLLTAILEHGLEPGQPFALLCHLTWLRSPSYAAVRRALVSRARLSSVVFLGEVGRVALHLHLNAELGLIVGTAGEPSAENPDVCRFIRVGATRDVTALLKDSLSRQGGENEHVVVFRDLPDPEVAWVFHRFTSEYRKQLEDAHELGSMTTLGALADFRMTAPTRDDSRTLRSVSDLAEFSPNELSQLVQVYGARSVQLNGELDAAEYLVAMPPDLEPGDLLIRHITRWGPSHRALVFAEFPGGRGIAGPHVIHMRWKAGVPASWRALLTTYLRSDVVDSYLKGHLDGVSVMAITPRELAELPVPQPDADIVNAMAGLEDARATLAEWESEIDDMMSLILSTRTYRGAVDEFLARQREIDQSIQAGKESRTFEYRVRHGFPHPFALRRERISLENAGADLLSQVRECAEHFTNYLLFLAVRPWLGEGNPGGVLATRLPPGRARLSWSVTRELLRTSLAALRKTADPLTFPVPVLLDLAKAVCDPASDWNRILDGMVEERNHASHLHRPTSDEAAARSERFRDDLDTLFRLAEAIIDTPLVCVEDYYIDDRTETRRAVLRRLVGSSPVFQREEREVDRELARDAVAIAGTDGSIEPLSPWVLRCECAKCHHEETFLFNELEEQRAVYVAMESGHTYRDAHLGARIAELLKPKSG